jgi:hypothetical protein
MPRALLLLLFAFLLFIACDEKTKTQAVSSESKDAVAVENLLERDKDSSESTGAVPSLENAEESELIENSGEETTESEHFVTKSDWEDLKCKRYYKDDGYTNIQECVFPNANLQQVYNIVKRVDRNLKIELPIENFKYSPSEAEGLEKNGCIEVNYKYKAEKHLFVELSYNGGETYVEIVEEENNARSKITYSAD